ncbi:MAG: VWA domain-containing protein [bacterium]|jgi:Ca-activated chloride channel family protein|nr:VWA domain-containing protein [candidate division KSB1 bacterium]MDH7561092.1 VWA domain-containing protein [bacterium]
MVRFANPEFLALLAVVPLLVLWYLKRQRRASGTIKYSQVGTLKQVGAARTSPWRHSLFVARLLAIVMAIVAFARPQSGRTAQEVTTEGVDIVMALDISTSMLAEDFKPKNRVEAAKEVAAQFIRGRKSDRIGLVVFAGKSFTQCPLTMDYGVLLTFMSQIEPGMIEDGTAIGMGLANAVNRLRQSTAKSKVIILLTDGRNNRGEVDPITAARIARAFKVRVYTIGVGTRGEALYPVQDPFFGKRYVRMPVEIDEDLLKEIARITGGRYFRATDTATLARIYQEIDELEKTKIEVKEYTTYKELFVRFLGVAFAALMVEVVLAHTRFRKIP